MHGNFTILESTNLGNHTHGNFEHLMIGIRSILGGGK